MLVELRISNFRSICDEQVFSMVASKDNTFPNNLIEAKGVLRLLKVAGMYGSNAAGKTNLIRAAVFLHQMVGQSATRMNIGDRIDDADPFLLSSETLTRPCMIEVTFIEGDTAYRYGFTATHERIHNEWLFAYTSERTETKWFDRTFDPETLRTVLTCDGPLKKYAGLLKERTRDNALVLSTGARENVKPLIAVFQWFRLKLWILNLSGAVGPIKQQAADLCNKDEVLLRKISRMLKDADFLIEGINVVTEELTLPDFATLTSEQRELTDAVRNLLAATQKESGQTPERQRIRTQHRMIDSDEVVTFDLEDESSGTQRFVAIAAPFLLALERGAVLFVDELDRSLHPNLTRKLIELFQSESVNARGGQLIFTTHDSSLLTPKLFRRDQMYLVEKLRNRGSEYFSLYDIQGKDRPRNSEAFERNYLSGRYGAVPHFGRTFEDLQLK